MKKYLLPLQAVMSILLVTAFVYYMPEGALRDLQQAKWGWVACGVCAFWLGQAVSSQRLYWLTAPLIRPSTAGFTPLFVARATLLGTFAGTFLPLNAAGDVLKLGMLTARTGTQSIPVLIAGILVERMLSVMVTFLFCTVMALACSLEFSIPLPVNAIWWGMLMLIPLVMGLRWVYCSPSRTATSIRLWLSGMREALRWWRENPAQLLLCMGLSLGNLLCGALQIAVLGLAVEQALTLSQALAAIGLVMVITYLPISISGLGVMEAGLAGLLISLGYPTAQAMQVSILLRLTTVAGCVPGIWIGTGWHGNVLSPTAAPSSGIDRDKAQSQT